MPSFRIKHIEAVWERSSWLVDAKDEDEAREKFRNGVTALEWTEVTGVVESADDEIESVERIEGDHDPNLCPCQRVPKSGCDGDNCREPG